MLEQIALGIVLMIAATIVHAIMTGLALKVLKDLHASHWILRSGLTEAIFIATVVTLLFVATLLETAIWAVTYWFCGAMASFEEALYFSIVTYTTLGFGDVTLDIQWRLLSSIEAANGVILLGWSTALVFAFVQRLVTLKYASKSGKPSPQSGPS